MSNTKCEVNNQVTCVIQCRRNHNFVYVFTFEFLVVFIAKTELYVHPSKVKLKRGCTEMDPGTGFVARGGRVNLYSVQSAIFLWHHFTGLWLP